MAANYSSSRQTCDTCSLDELALCCRTGASLVQFSGNTFAGASFPAWKRLHGEARNITWFASLFPAILSPKMTGYLAGSLHCLRVVKQL